MTFKDLRQYIDAVDRLGELQRVDGAHWNLEIGAITELVTERKGPALLFDNIPDYPSGYRVLTNAFTTLRRTALVLGLPLELKALDMLKAWRERVRTFKPVPPVDVRSGPVMENLLTGDRVDLFKFPAPMWHEMDGGRYLGTGCAVIVKDPQEKWVNIGTYRCMLLDKEPNRILVKVGASRHGHLIIDKYHARGESSPIAIAFGQDPALWMPATYYGVPWGVSEYDFAGWLRNSPVEVIISDVTGLPIPATAEIVIEGEIPPLPKGAQHTEGPFGEWLGYLADKNRGEAFIMNVKAIRYRDNPIIFGSPWLKPPHYCFAVPVQASAVWEQMEGAGVVGIKGVWTPIFDSPFIVVAAIKQMYPGHAKQAALAAAASRAANAGARFVIVVDDDVDITNFEEVFWAVSTRCDVNTIEIVHNMMVTAADPTFTPEERQNREFLRSRVIIDACRPFARIKTFPPVNIFSPEYRRQTAEKWKPLLDKVQGL